MSNFEKSFLVTLVSSQARTVSSLKRRMARRLISSELPMGVAIMYSVGMKMNPEKSVSNNSCIL